MDILNHFFASLLLFLNCRFNKDIGITGAILTKMDGDTRGGAALSVRGVSGKPIKFVGVGEGCISMNSIFDWTLHCILVYV